MSQMRVVLIAGGSGGIGKAIARRLAAPNRQLYIGYSRNRSAAEEIAAELNGSGLRAQACKLDVTQAGQAEELCAEIYQKCGQLDILVNAAGITRESPALGMDDEDWAAVLDVNLTGAFRLCRAAGKFMLLGRWGRMINLSSVVAHFGGRGQINYAAAKAGMERLTTVLAAELGRKGITANCVAPGVIETPMSERIRHEHGQELLAAIPAQRFGMPEEVAAAVAFLASEDAGYINGQVLRVDGGMP